MKANFKYFNLYLKEHYINLKKFDRLIMQYFTIQIIFVLFFTFFKITKNSENIEKKTYNFLINIRVIISI